MKTIKYTLIAAVAIAMASCSNHDEPATENDGAATVTANIGEIVSRAAETSWGNGDAIGISTTSTGKTQYTNMEYTTTGNGDFTHSGGKASGIFFQSMEEVTFSAYYPFSGAEGTEAGTINASTTDQTKQTSFDFLFAENGTARRTNPNLVLNFKHTMTRLCLKFNTDTQSGFTAADINSATFSLDGLKLSGTFDTATGVATATGEATSAWPITANTDAALILFPQSGADVKVTVAIDGQNYSCTIAPELAAGTSYTYSINVKKTGLKVGSLTIADWNTGESETVTAEME